MATYLLVADGVAPLGDSESASAAMGLSRALAAAGHQVTVLTLAAPDTAAATPGLARRLRTVVAKVRGQARALPLFEGRSSVSPAQLVVLGAEPGDRGDTCAILGTAAAALVADGLLKSDAAIGWGESSALALSALPASTRIFVLPTGLVGGSDGGSDGATARSFVALGVLASNAIVVPSPTASRLLGAHPDLASRPSDEPLIAARFGCDDPPNDPASDQTLAATYSAEAPAGKAECRRALARRMSLAVGPRTLIITTGPLTQAAGGEALLKALAQLTDEDVAVVINGKGDHALVERAKILGIEHAGKIGILADTGRDSDRPLLAGADAVILGDPDDRTARLAGLATRYGTLPLAPNTGANGDYLIDYDPASATGSALLYEGSGPFEILAVIRRAAALRAQAEGWAALVRSLMAASPRWATTVAVIDSLREDDRLRNGATVVPLSAA